MTVCKAVDEEYTWYIANNSNKSLAIREYKKDFRLKKYLKILKMVDSIIRINTLKFNSLLFVLEMLLYREREAI